MRNNVQVSLFYSNFANKYKIEEIDRKAYSS